MAEVQLPPQQRKCIFSASADEVFSADCRGQTSAHPYNWSRTDNQVSKLIFKIQMRHWRCACVLRPCEGSGWWLGGSSVSSGYGCSPVVVKVPGSRKTVLCNSKCFIHKPPDVTFSYARDDMKYTTCCRGKVTHYWWFFCGRRRIKANSNTILINPEMPRIFCPTFTRIPHIPPDSSCCSSAFLRCLHFQLAWFACVSFSVSWH